MAHHYGSFFSLTPATRFRSGYLLLTFLLLSGLSWGQCFKSGTAINVNNSFIAVGDFNGDGKPDFAATQHHYYQNPYYNSDSIAIFLNQGGGLFDRGTRSFVGDYADSLAVGDINTDGKLDVAVVDGRELISVMLGDGKGGLVTSTTLRISGYPASRILIDDFNIDGYPDLVTTGLYDSVTVLLNDGHAGFGKGIRYSAGKSTQIRSAKSGDFNGDGKLDLILLQDNNRDYYVSLLLNNGSGGFSAPIIIRDKAFSNVQSVEISDFNSDGKPDLVVATDSIALLLNKGNNSFTISKIASPNKGNYQPSPTLADFNSDGKTDLLFPGRLDYPNYPNPIFVPGHVLLGKGNGGFESPAEFNFTGPYSGFLPGDFNADGQTDLLAGLYDSVSIILNCTPPANTPPKATANDSQTATVGMPFAYTVNAFTDVETPNSLTYSPSLSPANGLSFDPATRLISGTPSLSGVTSVTITATDPGGLSGTTRFTITAKPPIILGLTEPGIGDVVLSPNPTTDVVHISLNNAYQGVVFMQVVAMDGQIVKTYTAGKTADSWQHTLSLQTLPAGSYYIRLQQNSIQVVSKVLKL